MIYFYCILCEGKPFNGSIQYKQVEQALDVNKLIDEIYNNNVLKETGIQRKTQ